MDLATLPPIGYAPRADAVRARLDERELTALAVTDVNNVRWLTGFTGSSGVAVLLPDSLVLVTDGRYADRASAETNAAGVDADIRIGFTQPQQHDL
ncbi:MAG TPA: aminopeptidase P family N-terminal domain-containing protein, partial [Ilumatobacter sp.]